MAADSELRRASLFVLQHATRRARAGWIDRCFVHVDVLDDTLFVDHEGGAIRESLLFVENPITLGDGALEVAEEWKFHSDLIGEHFVGGGTVNANPQDLRAILLELGDISLIRLELFRSTTGESEHVKR